MPPTSPATNEGHGASAPLRSQSSGFGISPRTWFATPSARRHSVIVAAAVLVVAYAVSVFGYVLSVPDIGLRCAFSPDINRVYQEFVYRQPPRRLEGTRIEQIGMHPVQTWPQVLRVLVELPKDEAESVDDPAALDDPKTTHVLLNGEELVRVQVRPAGEAAFSVWCRVGRSPMESLLPSVCWLLLKIGLFLVGALVFWKRPMDRPAARFFLLSTVTFGAFMGGYHWWRIVTQPVLLVCFVVCSVLLPAVSLHFYMVFPRPKTILERRPWTTLSAIYALPICFLIVLLSGYLRVRWLFRGGSPASGLPAALGAASDHVYRSLTAAPGLESALDLLLSHIYGCMAVAAALYLACVICLIHSYRYANNATERNQVKWILFGSLLAMVPMGYSLYLAFVEPTDFGAGAATWPMFAASAFMTAAFTISITRYRLMQLDQIISRSMAYFLASFLAGLTYYAVVFAGTWIYSQWIARPSLTQALGVSSAALVVLLVLDWVRGRVKRALDRRFYRDKHQLDRTLRRMSQAISQLVDPPTLARRLLQASAELLGVPQGAVYLREGDTPLYRLADSLGIPPRLEELSSGCPLVEALQARNVVRAHSYPARPADAAQRQLLFLGGELAQALVHEGEMLALLVLGPKELGAYGQDDLNSLAAFAQITVLALVSARGHRAVDSLNQELQDKVVKIAEQQRRILALQSQLRTSDPPVPPTHDAPAREASSTKVTVNESGIVGSSTQVRQLLHLVRKVSPSQATVLIRGESGTGKELLARALHDYSPRAGKAFVKVHCTALSPGLLESELFGHVKGAFTGAHRDKIGRFELANGGTLFLDEIGDISLETQTKLLRVLQEMVFERVGSSESVKVDVRIITATHQNLEELILQGRFREDLYYRLNVISIPMPPLRERAEDIPELAFHFLRQNAVRAGKQIAQIDDDAMAVLKGYQWPGNIRQLENVIERAVVITEGPIVTVDDLPLEVCEAREPAELVPAVKGNGSEVATVARGIRGERVERDRREREELVRALASANGNKAEAARALGLARSTLLSRLKKHGLN